MTDYKGVDMWKRTAALTALLVLTLTGCAGPVGDEGDESIAPASAESSTPAPEETTGPVTAKPSGDSEPDEAAFVEEARSRIARVQSQIPNATDEQLLDAGHEACDRLESGESSEQMSLIDGEEISESGYFMDSGAIISAARLTLCEDVTG